MVEELIAEIQKYRSYFQFSGGGITARKYRKSRSITLKVDFEAEV